MYVKSECICAVLDIFFEDITGKIMGVGVSFGSCLNACFIASSKRRHCNSLQKLPQTHLIEVTTACHALSSTSASDRIWSGATLFLIINLRASATLILSLLPFINHYGPAIPLMGDGSADWIQPQHSGHNTHLGLRLIGTEEPGLVPIHLRSSRHASRWRDTSLL